MTVDKSYNETRYYKKGDGAGTSNMGYDDLVRLNTEYNVPNSGLSTSYINSNLYQFFDFDYFKSAISGSGSGSGSDLIISKVESPTDVTIDDFILKTKGDNIGLTNYYNGISSYSNDYVIDNYIMDLAKKVTDYFVVSTALYELLYATTGDDIDGATTITVKRDPSLQIEYGGFDDSPFTLLPNEDTNSKQNSIIAYLYKIYVQSIEALKLNDADNSDTGFSGSLHENITLNSKFLENQGKLDTHQDKFDTKKAMVITMMAKAHKANKLYSKKKLWFTIYLSMLIVYLLAVIGVIYASSSSYEMLNMFQNSMVGFVLIVFNAIILISLFFYEISKYFYK
jgi:hypothetical protein